MSRVTILDGNAITFDLTDAVQLVNFAVTLIRLRIEHVPRILEAFGHKNPGPEGLDRLSELARRKTVKPEGWSWKRAPRPRKRTATVKPEFVSTVTSHE